MNGLKFVIILCILGLISCNTKNNFIQPKEIKKYYLAYNSRHNSIDTFKYRDDNEELKKLNAIDSLKINYQKHFITIKKYTNLPNAPLDGEFVEHWEKSVGVFYFRSLSWYNFAILQTNNDSINRYIMGLLGNLLLYEKMYSDPLDSKSEINFVPSELKQ